MSGGTDSSVAAILLKESGYDVTGVTFRFYEKENETTYLDDARALCDKLDIPHITYDARKRFEEEIITYFIKEYLAGNTPVPCTLCNNLLKWPLLARLADEHGVSHIATGHYVRKKKVGGYWHIAEGKDSHKDQSFFLWGLSQEILQRMLLPLGELHKTRVREIAAERGFLKAACKRDSLGVCFCPGDYRSFLKKQVPENTIRPGDYYDEEGHYLGRHEGFPFYTIGQRRGLGVYLNKALFVKEIFPEENKIILSDDIHTLERSDLYLSQWQMADPEKVFGSHADLTVRIRYRNQSNHCHVSLTPEGLLHVCLHEPLASVATGQAAAFYRGEIVVGGGIIIAR